MTAHTCTTFKPGCYRCELGADELRCQRTAGTFEVTVMDGVAYDPPMITPARCGLLEGHPGQCAP